jgi:tetratricopeptide (TPR) repeat protein
VEGRVFHAGAVTTLSPDTVRPNVRSRLLALARKELIRPDRPEFAGEDAFRFRHLLIRDAAYQAMPKEHRAELHERFADWLADAARERMAEYEEILAYHLEQAYRYRAELGAIDEQAQDIRRRAVAHLLASATRADDRGDPSTSRRLLERTIDIADGHDLIRATTLLTQILVIDFGEFRLGLELAARTIEVAQAIGDRAGVLQGELDRTMFTANVDPSHTMTETTADIEAILAEAEGLGDEPLRWAATVGLSVFRFFAGRIADAVRLVEPLLDEAATMPRRVRQGIAEQLGVCAYFGPSPVPVALDMVERAQELRGDSLAAQATGLRMFGSLLGMAGRFDEFDDAVARSTAMFDELGIPSRAITANQAIGETLRLQGRLEEAERLFRDMVAFYDQMGETAFNSTVCELLAEVLCDQGRYDEAEPFADRSRAMAANDDWASQAGWRVARARILSHRGDAMEALRLADEAVALADATDYLTWQASIHEVRGEVLEAGGRVDEARAAYEMALDRFVRKDNVVAAPRVRDRISALG